MQSALYTGILTHRRDLAPAHRFAYRMRLLWLDLDELADLFARSRGWSWQKPAIGWLRRRDYLRPETASLAQAVRDEVSSQLGVTPTGPIRMLTAPRVFGIGFNPLTLYYCYGTDGNTLEFVLAEVRNTPWLQRHCYALDLRHADTAGSSAEHAKQFHVSPFLPMDMAYHWQLQLPGEQLNVLIRNERAGVTVFRAVLALQRHAELTPALLQRELWQHWPQGLKTLAGIYWQAVKLLLRRARFYGHPGPHRPATIISGVPSGHPSPTPNSPERVT
ncbi:DUF1365 domain-containing protein [Permianibacter sp. IMCC34836]|uniref:DUF1365 domain-containing protein n=1 Tax=Permianibacter fluminis TaxID=2738515 RepID=UPI0015528628|nr:DUF1365 domain-containing protein [Permianibacter fluminis]NQD36863.1 DUF1365 domain-containing protein [Permianibacter fluminis]